VRRIFTMGLPRLHASYSYQQHGGQILFRPSDGRLYLVTGNGGQRARGHQLDSSKNKRSFLGKVIRFDVDRVPGKRLDHNWIYIYIHA
jgi:glucose/arabinose dehydrogenase